LTRLKKEIATVNKAEDRGGGKDNKSPGGEGRTGSSKEDRRRVSQEKECIRGG